MRTFKFRAWDKEFEMMFYSNSSDDPLNVTGERIHHLCGCKKPEGHLDYFFFEKAPIMQFTDLHDSKGNEIYEGDIIKMSEPQYHWSQNKAVYWQEDRFTIGQHAPLTGIRNYTEYSVIGNVYEHPDLLKGE